MLMVRATRIVAISRSRVGNSLIFRSALLVCASFFIRAVGVFPLISSCACRARISLRTCWPRWSCHWSCCWSSLAPSDK